MLESGGLVFGVRENNTMSLCGPAGVTGSESNHMR